MISQTSETLFQPLELPCGSILKNRIAKSAMSDSLGDGRGNPTPSQLKLYETWAEGGLGLSIVGEVQSIPDYPEKPGHLVLDPNSDFPRFGALAQMGAKNGAQLWLQLGHAGAMAHGPISIPKGPSAIDIPGLKCAAMTREEISGLPSMFARTAALAKRLGFGGVEIHVAIEFAKQARQRTNTPLMLTGGVKTLQQAVEIISSGAADVVGLARALVLYPDLANRWRRGAENRPAFPRFSSTPEGGVTAWYTMKLIETVEPHEQTATLDIDAALEIYLKRDAERVIDWNTHFSSAKSIPGAL